MQRTTPHVIMLITAAFLLTGCTAKYARLTAPDEEYRQALSSSSAACTKDPLITARGLEQVQLLFHDYTVTNIRAEVRNTYADEFFFRDGFTYLTKLDALETYMVHGAEPLRHCTFTFEEPIILQTGDCYLKWIMHVSLPDDPPDHMDEAIGMTHLRFNQDGNVIFHQDYWDPTDVLYRRIPIANWLIGVVRKRL